MNFKPNKLKKTIVVFLCFFFFSTSVGLVTFTPQKTHADSVWEIGGNLAMNMISQLQNYKTALSTYALEYKEWVADGVVWAAVKEILAAQIKDQIINNIVNSTGGVPAYVTDPFRFINDLEKEVAEITINAILDGLNLAEIENLFPNSNVSDILTERHTGHVDDRLSEIFTPTLRDVVNADGDFDEFQDGNFYQGGWAGFFSLTQNPKNNPAGSYFLAEQAIAEAQNEREEAMLNELSWGNGYISKRTGAGTISVPGKLMSDQLNEALTSDLRTIENADEVLEGVALLAGALIGNILGSDGLSDGSYADVTTSTATSSLVDKPTKAGGGTTVTENNITLDIEDALVFVYGTGNWSVHNFTIDDSKLEMQNGYTVTGGNANTDPTISASSVTVGSGSVVVDDGTEHGELMGKVMGVGGVTVTNPVFATLSNSNATNPGPIDNAKILGQVNFNLNSTATGALLTTAVLELSVDASSPTDYINALVEPGSEGTIIDELEFFGPPELVIFDDPHIGGEERNNWASTTGVRGGSTSDVSTMTLNDVVLIGGEFTSGGVDYEIVNPYDVWCEGIGTECGVPSVSDVQGADLQIDDTSELTWALMNRTMTDQTVSVNGDYEIYHGVVTGP